MPFEEIAKEIAQYVMDRYVSQWGKDLVRYYRAEVVTPASNGKITVKRPFDGINLTLPCTTAAENLTAGQQCIVFVLGNESNAIVFSDGMMQSIGSGGGGGGGTTYTYTQMTAATQWVITHNLNRYPSVSVTDMNGNTMLPDVQYTSANAVTLTFTEASSGYAYLN